jgi:hypothetical protein
MSKKIVFKCGILVMPKREGTILCTENRGLESINTWGWRVLDEKTWGRRKKMFITRANVTS